MEKNAVCPACRTTHRSPEERKALSNRLSRIEGQIRGLKGMLEKDAYCVDILTQSSAVAAALEGFNRELLSSHIRSCVVRDIRSGDDGATEELVELLKKLIR